MAFPTPTDESLDVFVGKPDLSKFVVTGDDTAEEPEEAAESGAVSFDELFQSLGDDNDSFSEEQSESKEEVSTEKEPIVVLSTPTLDTTAAIDPVGLYLKEMARVPLLNMEQEISLAKRIEKGRKSHKKLTRLNGAATPKNKVNLGAFVDDGKEARSQLIQANTRLVVSIAKKYIGRGVPFLDLIQEGNLGLMKAVEKYDYKRGFRFSTYATWWIRQTITRAIAEQGRTIRVPVHMVDRIRLMYKAAHELEQKLGRPPTTEELAESMELDPQRVEWMIQVSWLPLSLESPVGDEEDSELGMFVEDTSSPTPTQLTYENMLREKIHEVLATLSPREARILRLRFGLENGRSYTLEEIGKKFGLTRERIRQIEGKALRRLRHPRRSRQLQEYL
jgi:RNA polymerase primary sigma factor